MFKGITLEVEDLYLLESFQIESLKQFAPKKELAAVLHAYNDIHRFLITKYPPIASFITEIMGNHGPADDQKQLEDYIDLLVWELGLMLVSNKLPEEYDNRVSLHWDLDEITSITPLNGKVVMDAGAGTGNIAFSVVNQSQTVFAVEPVSSFREFMRQKAKQSGITNLFVIDGLLHEIPLPRDSVDVLITSNAIGWSFDQELKEIERVVKSCGYAIHLLIGPKTSEVEPIQQTLTSSIWNYQFKEVKSNGEIKIKYWKQID
jgi:ubiquinone/menaquinone biosynthesis C-methylase UbiE